MYVGLLEFVIIFILLLTLQICGGKNYCFTRPNTLTKIVFSTLNRQLSLTLRLISGICEEVMDPSALWFYILSESSRLTQFFSYYMNIALLQLAEMLS